MQDLFSNDRTAIVTKRNPTVLQRMLSPRYIRPHVRKRPRYKPNGTGATLELLQPTPEAFAVLTRWKSYLGEHCLAELEIAKDIPCTSEEEAIWMLEHAKGKLYLRGFEDVPSRIVPTPEGKRTPEKFGPHTEYVGPQHHLQLKLYCRTIKDGSGTPALRLEFVLRQPYLQEIGLHCVDTLEGVDSETYAIWWNGLWCEFVEEKTHYDRTR
jgi:hypothetical protein